MSKSSFIIGLAVAVLLHLALIVPWQSPSPKQATNPPEPGRLVVQPAQQPPEEPPPAAAAPAPQTPATQTPAPPALTELTRLPTNPSSDRGPLTAEDIPEDSLPPMRILWQGPDELREVARMLGLRIVAVSRSKEVIGEVVLDGEPSIQPIQGDFAFEAFSNRVRNIPANYFGPRLARTTSQLGEIWVLVPVALDQEFSQIQRQAIVREGLEPAQIRSMEARFQAQRGGSPALTVVRIITGNTGRSASNG